MYFDLLIAVLSLGVVKPGQTRLCLAGSLTVVSIHRTHILALFPISFPLYQDIRGLCISDTNVSPLPLPWWPQRALETCATMSEVLTLVTAVFSLTEGLSYSLVNQYSGLLYDLRIIGEFNWKELLWRDETYKNKNINIHEIEFPLIFFFWNGLL